VLIFPRTVQCMCVTRQSRLNVLGGPGPPGIGPHGKGMRGGRCTSGFPAYFFTPNPDIQILSEFFVQFRICHIYWHRASSEQAGNTHIQETHQEMR